jgi:type 1 glutamine amidotransferase
MKSKWFVSIVLAVFCFSMTAGVMGAEPIKALIVDGQNNHGNWPQTTEMMKSYLTETGLFQVDVARTAPSGKDPNFAPKFSDYRVVISNYNGADWPESTQKSFEEYVRGGGGFVVIHAANNAFPDWAEYNRMIGLGGWGGRNEKSGPYVYLDKEEKLVRSEDKGPGGRHGSQHPFQIVVRNGDHPITSGVPRAWMHAQDELYDYLRGPAQNMTILATAFADPKFGGSGRHEPMLMVLEYGKGRIFHTPMGHGNNSQECVGFITLLVRGTEWAATGNVTLPVPSDFPKADATASRPFKK